MFSYGTLWGPITLLDNYCIHSSNRMPHIHEKIDWTVSVFIVHESQVLLRMHEKYHTLLAVGGHVELDEEPATTAVRECMEEVGLPITIHTDKPVPKSTEDGFRFLPVPSGINIHHTDPMHQHIDLVYFATTAHANIVPEHPDDTWEWFTREELSAREDIRDNVKYYAFRALDALGSQS